MGTTEQFIDLGGHEVRITNPDKVMFPSTGTTKGDMIDYYRRVSSVLVPLLMGRPVTRKRWVDGVGTANSPNSPFFAKQLERGAPEWIKQMSQEHATGVKAYPLVDQEATLVWLAQMASIELHVPQWRYTASGKPGRPDRLVLDLDPGPGAGLAHCAQVARIARERLTEMGLEAVPVTSGSKGIHVYAPLRKGADGSAIAKHLAESIAADHPDLVTNVMAKSQRPGRVFIDWSQNHPAKTTVSPYSLRGRSRPWVAAPRTWAELDERDLHQLEYTQVLHRITTAPWVDTPLFSTTQAL